MSEMSVRKYAVRRSWITRDGNIAVELDVVSEGWLVVESFQPAGEGMWRRYLRNDRIPRMSRWSEAQRLAYYSERYLGLTDALANPQKHRDHYAANDERCVYCELHEPGGALYRAAAV